MNEGLEPDIDKSKGNRLPGLLKDGISVYNDPSPRQVVGKDFP